MYYFDYAATYPLTLNYVLMRILMELSEKLEMFGNPSSSHELGFKSAQILEKSREIIGNHLDCSPKEIIFTSGGTESDNMALKGVMLKYKSEEAELITSTIEHPAILNTCKQLERLGYTIKYVKPNIEGIVDAKDIEKEITDKTKLISIMAVNNEIGTIQPIYEIAKIAHKNNILFHTDAVQSIGCVDLFLSEVDMASFSGHKFGSLKGTGILYKKEDIELEPLICGGGQENNIRSGTENVLGNWIMAKALDEYYIKTKTKERDESISISNRMITMKNDFISELEKEFGDNIMINSYHGSPNIINVAFKDIDGDTLQLLLSNKGFIVSTGSACHSGSSEPSYVLQEIGVPKEYLKGEIRISLSPDTNRNDLFKLLKEIIFHAKYLMNKTKGE